MTQVIKLSDKAADRIKEILSENKDSLGVRIGVKSGGCAGMSYIMEYAKTQQPNDELIAVSYTHLTLPTKDGV